MNLDNWAHMQRTANRAVAQKLTRTAARAEGLTWLASAPTSLLGLWAPEGTIVEAIRVGNIDSLISSGVPIGALWQSGRICTLFAGQELVIVCERDSIWVALRREGGP